MMHWLLPLALLLFGAWVLGRRVDSFSERRPPNVDGARGDRSADQASPLERARNAPVRAFIATLLAVPITALCLSNLDRSTGSLRLVSTWNAVTLTLIVLGIITIAIEIARRTRYRRSSEGAND